MASNQIVCKRNQIGFGCWPLLHMLSRSWIQVQVLKLDLFRLTTDRRVYKEEGNRNRMCVFHYRYIASHSLLEGLGLGGYM